MSRNNRLNGKVAIVTGSTAGIGFAIAKRFAKEGAKVVISSRHQKNVDRAIDQLREDGLGDKFVGTVCHVAKAKDRKRIFDEAVKLGGLHILVSNVAVYPQRVRISECSEGMWDKIFEVNVKAGFLLAKEAYPLFQKSGGGKLIYISSVGGYLYNSLLGPYSVSKTAIQGLIKAFSQDVGLENITVNCIAPGYIPTRFSEEPDKSTQNDWIDIIPMKRLGTLEEIAGVAAFLASDDSSYITGETIVVSGGMYSRL